MLIFFNLLFQHITFQNFLYQKILPFKVPGYMLNHPIKCEYLWSSLPYNE